MMNNTKRILEIIFFSVFFIFIIIFVFFRSHDLIFGVKIKNVNLKDGSVVTENLIKVTGIAKNAITLELNGREISVDQNGNFKETIALLSGYNIISIVAKDKFGYVDRKNYQLIYQK